MIDSKIKELSNGRLDYSTFLHGRMRKLITTFNDCPDCITVAEGDKKSRANRVSDDVYEKLTLISLKMKIDESTVIDRFIIQPLLLPINQ